MSTHCIFKLASRPYGDSHTTYAQIVCGYCDHAEWHVARDSGLAVRVFRSHGWKVGNKPNQHRCPLCFSRAKSARRIPDNPAIPREIGKKLKEKILSDHLKDVLLGSTILKPEGPHAMPHPRNDRTAEAPEIATGPVVVLAIKARRGMLSTPGQTQFTTRSLAAKAGAKATGSADGIEFFTVPFGDGWTFKLAVNTTPSERQHWRATRKYGPRKHRSRPDRIAQTAPALAPLHGAIEPVEDTDMKTPIAKSTASIPQITKEPMNQITPLPDRTITRDERGSIHDELTKVYGIVGQRYAKTDSDEAVAARLNVPRAWVKDIREQFFGDFDRNDQSEAKIKALDEATDFAEAAMSELIEMAQRAESIAASLRALRKKLEG